MAVGTTVKQGDTLPALVRQVLNDPVWPARTGTPIDLSAATRIFWVLRHEETKTVLGAWAADIVGDATDGTTTTPLLAEMSAHPGLVSIDIVVEEAGGVRTFPSTPQDLNSSFMVRRSLTVPDVVSIPTITPAAGNEVDLGEVLPLVEGVELFVLTAIDGVNQPGIYRWDATAGAYISAETTTAPAGAVDLQTFVVTAAETISAFNVVAQGTAGAVLYEPTVANPLDVFGVAVTASAAGGTIEVVTDGLASGAVGLTPGATYYAAAAGGLTAVRPTAGLLVVIGYAATATDLVVQVGEPLEL